MSSSVQRIFFYILADSSTRDSCEGKYMQTVLSSLTPTKDKVRLLIHKPYAKCEIQESFSFWFVT